MPKRKKKYWIKFYIGECPICGSDKSYKERVYGKKPKSARKRYETIPPEHCYDYCL